MKRTILVLGLLFLTGCTTPKEMNKTMASWVGKSFSDIIASWGPPHQIIDDGDNGRIATWIFTTSYTSPGRMTSQTYSNNFHIPGGSLDTHSTYEPPKTTTYTKTRTFWIGKDGIIYKWAWKGL